MASAMSADAWNAKGRAIWERDGKRCARCGCDLPDFRDCRTDTGSQQVQGAEDDNLRTLCQACYILRGDTRRWRTANIGAMIAAGVLPINWRELVWYEGDTAAA